MLYAHLHSLSNYKRLSLVSSSCCKSVWLVPLVTRAPLVVEIQWTVMSDSWSPRVVVGYNTYVPLVPCTSCSWFIVSSSCELNTYWLLVPEDKSTRVEDTYYMRYTGTRGTYVTTTRGDWNNTVSQPQEVHRLSILIRKIITGNWKFPIYGTRIL